MAMMEKIRGATESGTMKIVLGIIVVVFVFWGIGTGGRPTSQLVATVDGKRITDTRFHKVMRNVSRSQERNLTEEQQRALARQVIQSLIAEEVMLQEADRRGVEVSDEEVARHILQYDAFKDETGHFSSELYQRHLKRFGTTQPLFEEDLRKQRIIERLQDVALAAVGVSDAEITEQWRAENTSFQLDTVTVRALGFYDDVEPTEREIESFIAENRPEIRAWYDQQFESRFHKPVRALARMITLRADPEVDDDALLDARGESIRAEIEAGAEFAQLARKYSEDLTAENGGMLGEVRFDQLDATVGRTIFGPDADPYDQAGLRHTVRTDRGLHIIWVEQMLPEETTDEQEARPEIARILMRERQAPQLASAYAEQLQGAWAESGAAPLDLLLAQELSIVPAGPITLFEPTLPGFEEVSGLRQALELTGSGELLPTVMEVPGAWIVCRVSERIEPDEDQLAEELPKLRNRVAALKRVGFLEAWRDDLVAQADIKEYHQF